MMRRGKSAAESEMQQLHVTVPDNISNPANEAPPIGAPNHFLLPLYDSPPTIEPDAHFSRGVALQILFRQFKGLPPPSDLAVEPSNNRFSLLCSPKALLRKVGISVDCAGGRSPDDILYDHNTASVPGFHLPLVLNMIGDSVKNRLLNVLGFACIFCSVVLILASFVFVSPLPPIPNKIILVGQPNSESLQTSCPDTSGPLLYPCLMYVNLQVTSADGTSVPNKRIIVSELFQNAFFTVDSPFSPVGKTYVRNDGSSDSYRYDAASSFVFTSNGVPSGTLSRIRGASNIISQPFASGDSPVITDSDGLATVVIVALRSPPGPRTLKFFCGDVSGNATVSLDIFISSLVAKIVPLSPSPSSSVQTIGTPFTMQPSFKLCSSLSDLGQCLGVPFQVVVAVAESTVTDGSLDGNKMAHLTGFVSAKSDAYGVATFTNLGVVGSSSQRVYFSFYAGGKAWSTWDGSACSPANPSRCLSYVKLSGGPLIQSLTMSSAPTVVQEGAVFPSITIQALSTGNSYVPNVVIYAQFTRIAGSAAPKFTTPLTFGKKLLRASAVTDQKGQALFNLSTSLAGFAGEYEITFLPSLASLNTNFLPVISVLIATSVVSVAFEGPHMVVRSLMRSYNLTSSFGHVVATTAADMRSTDYESFFRLYFNVAQQTTKPPKYVVTATDAMSNFVPGKLVEIISDPANVLDLGADTYDFFGDFAIGLLPVTLLSTGSVELFLKLANPIPLALWPQPPVQLFGINTARFNFVIDGVKSSSFVTVFLTPPVPPAPIPPSVIFSNVQTIFTVLRNGNYYVAPEDVLTSICNIDAPFNASNCAPQNIYSHGQSSYCIPNCPSSLSLLLPVWYQFVLPLFYFILLPKPGNAMSRVVGTAEVGSSPFSLKYGVTTFDGSPVPSSRLSVAATYFKRYRTIPIANSQSLKVIDQRSATKGLDSLSNNVYATTASPFYFVPNVSAWYTENIEVLQCFSASSRCNMSGKNFSTAPAAFTQNFSYSSGISGSVFVDIGLQFQEAEIFEDLEYGPPSSVPAHPRNPLDNWLLLPPQSSLFSTLGLTLKFERSQMVLEISNRVAAVELVSSTPNAGGGIDIVATVRDASGAPVTGRSLSCWIRSTCGLVRDMVPGWVDTATFIAISKAVPYREDLSTSQMFLPSYCSGAGYPEYVFDLHQAANGTYLTSQLFLHYVPLAELSQLLSEKTLAIILNSSNSSPVPPPDTITNNLVSPLFYGLQSTSVSGPQGRVSLTGVRVHKHLPGAWTLQCGVDGVMMDSPVTLIDEFSSQIKRPAKLTVVTFPLNCSSPLNNPLNPCAWHLYTRRIPSSVASAKVQVVDETGAPLANITLHMVIVPLGPSIPRPYSSTAHLPTPFAHRLISKFNNPPGKPPGESAWPSFVQTYGSAISSPSDASGVATFDNIGLFDLPKGAIFQVIFAFSPGVSGAVWSNNTAIPAPGIFALPYYQANNIISTCGITRQPTSAIPQRSDFLSSPFTVQVGNDPNEPYRYVIASVHIVVRQSGVILGGATSVVDPFSGTASLAKFQLVSALNYDSLTYDVMRNSVPIGVIPFQVGFIFLEIVLKRSIVVGVQSASVNYNILDANYALLVGVVVQIMALNASIVLQGVSGQATPQSVSSPSFASILQFVVTSAVTGTYEFVLVAPGNVFSAPFYLQVTNPVQSILIVRQPQGSVETAVELTVQPRLSIISSGPSIAGQQVRATVDASCNSGASLLFDSCTILPDSTCEFRGLAVIGINQEGSQKVCFRFSIFGISSQISQPVYVTNPNVPELSQLNEWQTITWSVVLLFVPIGAMNNSESGAFVWFIGLGSFLFFCSTQIPRFILNYSSVSNPPSEYTVIFVINISLLFVFVLVFLFEVFCAVRRRIVAVKSGESEAMHMFPRLFSNYRQKRWKDLVHILLAKRSTLKILLQDMIPPEQNSSLIPNAESENASEVESTFVAKDGAQSPDGQFETSKKKILDLAQIAFLRIEQVRFKLARLGKSRSLHEVFEGNRHFYYPQRLLISFSLSLVGAVFFLAVFMYLISESCKVLTSWRKQILNILAQVDSFIGAAPTYLKLMSSGLVSGLAGRADDATDTGLPVWVSSFLQQGASSATASSAQVIVQFTKLSTKMQELRNDFPYIASLLSSESNEFDRVLKIIQISAICAIAISALIIPILWFFIFANWRMRIMEMRQGRYIFDRTQINPSNASNFIGFQFWGFIGTLAFLILFIFYPVCLAIGLLGTYPSLITNYIWPVIKNILIGLFVVQSLTVVFKFVAKIFLTRDGVIVHLRLFLIYDYAYSILSIISGFVALLVTCIVTFLSSFVSLTRLDMQKIPISAVSNAMEPAFGAFCAALMVDHDNTNPIKFMVLEWFCSRLQSIRKDEEMFLFSAERTFIDGADDRKTKRRSAKIRGERIRNRFHLWIVLSQNPSLCKFRKQVIQKTLDELQIAGRVDEVGKLLSEKAGFSQNAQRFQVVT